jgi:hypothetical protein
MTVPSCDCESWTDDDEGFTLDHEADCPHYYDHLHTAEDIARFRLMIMYWDEQADGSRGTDVKELGHLVAAKMADGVTARAIELGLEQ